MAYSPYVDPVTPIPTSTAPLQGRGYSDAAVKQLRDYAAALLNRKSAMPTFTKGAIGMGLADFTKDITSALAAKQADEMERGTIDKTGANVAGPATGGTPQTDAVSGGAAAKTPFQEPRRGSTPSSTSTRLASLETGAEVDNDAEGPSAAAMRLSSKGETGKNGIAALFNISPDTSNSKSYGPFGLNSKSGSVQQFAKGHPELGLTAEPGTPEFDEQWRKAAATNSEGMNKAHKDWHDKNIMGGLADSMIKAGVDPSIANDPRVQTYMADRKVQMGGAGLNTALLYGRLSNSPEEFIRRVSQVDKERIPYNFQTYLRDHPNDARGLANRIDLRHNTALAGTDPDLTASMVDYHRTKNGAGTALAQSIPPTQLAQNGPVPSYIQPQPPLPGQPLPQGRLQAEMGQLVRNLMVGGQRTLPQALEAAEQILKMRSGTMPQYQVDEYGRAVRQAPGELPQVLPGVLPGFFGTFKEQPDMGGAGIRTYIDPATGYPARRYEVPYPPLPPGQAPPGVGLPKPRTDVTPPATTPPVTAPTNAIVKAPPVAPVATPPVLGATPAGGILASEPPLPKGQIASAMPNSEILAEAANQAMNKPSKFDKLAQAEKAPDLNKPVTPEEQGAKEALDWAEEHPTAPPKMPPIVGPALQSGDIDELANIKSNRKAHEEALSDTIKESKKEYGKFQNSFRDASIQAQKLRPGLKTAIKLLDSPDFQSGPGNELVGLGRGLREELGRLSQGWASDAIKRGEDPGIYKTISDWALDPSNRTATANQIYQKILQGTILQSLRGMLGPNAGQFRVQELKMLEQAFGNPNLTLPANKAVMSMVDKLNDRNIILGQMASEYARKHNGLDPSFEQAVNKFELEHPPYTPEEYAETLRLAEGGAPITSAPGASPPKSDPLGIRRK